jgi:plasmid stabilization system protein ParE
LAQVIYASRSVRDLDRLVDLLLQAADDDALDVVRLIAEAVDVLANHPLMGRPVEQGLRELVISQGKSGYVALCSYEREQDVVLVLAIRHQREAGYVHPSAL